jgi:hypothetical protein
MKPVEFVQRNKFLIGVGVLVLAGVVACIGVFLPVRKTNAAEVARLEAKAKSLNDYAVKKDVASEADVPEARKLTQTYQANLDDLHAYLAKQDQPLEEPLKEQRGPGAPPATGQLEGSVWKLVYNRDVDDLLKELQSSFLIVGANPIVAQSFGDEIPSAEEIATVSRYLRVEQYAVSAIAALNKAPTPHAVPVFNGFSFLSAPERLLSAAHGTEFTPIPFEIRLSTEFSTIPRVLHSLLTSPVQFEITSISVSRPERLERGSEQAAWAARTRAVAAPAAPKVAVAAPSARTVTAPPTGGALGPGPGYMGPSAEAIQEMVERQKQMAQAQAEAMKGNMPTFTPGTMPGMPPGMQPGMPSGPTAPAARQPRTRSMRSTTGTQVTEQIKAQLPKTLVDLTIRGYVADYQKKTTN